MGKEKDGHIEIICGSMFSGKTEELIRLLRRAVIARQKVQVFKPMIDNRYHQQKVQSHNGLNYEAKPVQLASDILSSLELETTVVGIDEIQFFDDQIVSVCEQLANDGMRVVCAGLDMDFRGIPFGCMPALLARAEKVTKLHAICVVCGEEASRTQRLVNGEAAAEDDPIVLIGAEEVYEARCRACHQLLPARGEYND